MRIIAGSKRGLKLLSPKGNGTRPIIDRAKESLFSILYKYDLIEDGVIGDLFCGTGSMGLEALSRGAKRVVFVERDRRTVEILRKNIIKANFFDQSKIITSNAFKTGAGIIDEDQKCSLIFVDPPYVLTTDTDEKSQLASLLKVLAEQLTPDGIVSVRTHKKTQLTDIYGDLTIVDRRQWASMAVTLLQLNRSD